MNRFLVIVATALSCIGAADVELISGAPVAPVAPLAPTVPVAPVASLAPTYVTSRSSQYFARNYNALAAPLITPVAPVVARAPVSISQVTRFVQGAPVAPVAPVSPAAIPNPDDTIEIEAARVRSISRDTEKLQRERPLTQNVAPRSQPQLTKAAVKNQPLVAAPVAPLRVSYVASPFVGVPYYL
ncbi:A-kinase anchor protein 14-like [Cylas formicarius]|uniref:A-kinase anchor protein 14-like n=1 Tax=Cylas formicarius TaxID=197179 RepID=UPI002958C282|nr:A-kinase anchor protein 14-like [Cylas formicarius]